MFKFIKDRRAKKQAEQERKDKEYTEKKQAFYDSKQAEIDEKEKELFVKHCPINNGNCSKDCIHFGKGYLEVEAHFGELGLLYSYDVIHSSCKLWDKQ